MAKTGLRHAGLLAACAVLIFIIFASLGSWQVVRLSWKLDLIARVNQRVHAQSVPAPRSEQWSQLNASDDEYRRVNIEGSFIQGQDTLVLAVTERGSGFWVITPLRVADGTVVMVNRGFIPSEAARIVAPAVADAHNISSVRGLLRMAQSGGAFLRQNDPGNRRWYSRDVQAIAKTNGLTRVAPYFIDMDVASAPPPKPSAASAVVVPVGGLTVIAFHNSHLVYALTWYVLAAMVAGVTWYFYRAQRRFRCDQPGEGPDHATNR